MPRSSRSAPGAQSRFGAVVMAAGEGRRFGGPKQLLEVGGVPLVCRAAAAARAAGVEYVAVVTGAHAEAVTAAVEAWAAGLDEDASVEVVHNADWASGMRGSLREGVRAVVARADPVACFVLLADQPAVDGALLWSFAERLTAGAADAVALAYPSGPGVPALFSRKLYPRLMGEEEGYPAEGAKAVLRDAAVRTALVDAPAQRFDVDTPADWETWRR